MGAATELLFGVLAYVCTMGALSQSAKCASCTHRFRQSCYLVIEDRLEWNEARSNCLSLEPPAYLAEVNDAEENEFINSIVDSSIPAWLGGTDAAAEGQWVWDHSAAPINTFFWLTNGIEPHNVNDQNCLLTHMGGWSDADCFYSFGSICEFPCEDQCADTCDDVCR